jgi:cation diffusion facilitator CzcD-associated flavoprotein CzcO
MTEPSTPGTAPDQDNASPETPRQIGRRGFLRGAAALTVGSLGTTAQLDRPEAQPAAAPAPAAPLLNLEEQTRRALRWLGRDPADWVRARSGVDHNVVIVGGGQSGLSIAHGLRRKGVGRVEVIDRAPPGQAGIWRTIARMHQLRTPKTLAGPELGNPALSFRAWYETLNGAAAFDALDRIPRLQWADYIDWFQQATGTTVRHGTRLVEIEPAGEVLRLHLESNGVRTVETTRKLVLANGYAGAGGPNVPEFVRALPATVWTHTTGTLRAEAMDGKVVGIVGAGSSAFDAAAVALESGASEVHLFSRRSYIDYPAPPSPSAAAPPPDRGYPNMLELGTNGRINGRVGGRRFRFDHLIAGTGYRIDLAAQPELARIHQHIALWRDRYRPIAGEENAAGAIHPYLGAGFEFLPRDGTGAEFLRNVHCFNLAGALSFGIPVGDVPSVVDQPRLTTAIARDLYVESVDSAAHERFIAAPLAAPSAEPYERAVATREVA